MSVTFLHLHSHFLFAFAIDREMVAGGHSQWEHNQSWIGGLDKFIKYHDAPGRSRVVDRIGPWKRASYTLFDLDSRAYQDMVFFYSYVRHVFFDAQAAGKDEEWESLIRVYEIDLKDQQVHLRCDDGRPGHPEMQVTDLRLFLFANGMGILAIGVEGQNISSREALWTNEMMRKLYPSSGRAGREGRAPNRMVLSKGTGEQAEIIAEESFQSACLRGFQPPLSKIVTSLLYFLDYDKQEYEQVLDERMILYSYGAIDPGSCPADFIGSEQYEILLSHFLYVDREMPAYRYDREFVRKQMAYQVYRRWAHEGTYYGFTNYSNITLCLGVEDRGDHVLKEGFLIHRMFSHRYYLMAIVALFYRAALLDFAEKSALVSKRLFSEQERGTISRPNLDLAHSLRSEFLHFTNYWYFEELANKEEENEHFDMQCRAYRLPEMKTEIEEELGKMDSFLQDYNQRRSTEAVNRLAMLSMILGAGAVVTGFFGMNFGRRFGFLLFEPSDTAAHLHNLSIAFVTLSALGALFLVGTLIGSNWSDYKEIFLPRSRRARSRPTWNSLRDPGEKS